MSCGVDIAGSKNKAYQRHESLDETKTLETTECHHDQVLEVDPAV